MSGLRVEHDGAITTLTIDRPERRNALDRATLESMSSALEEAHARPETRVVVIAGGEKAFSTGADLNEYVHYRALEVRRANLETWMAVFDAIEALDEPVIASVGGYAIAGGTELTLACDLVIAADDAVFGLSEARVGVIPGAGACVRLPRWVGRAAAKEILMFGDPIDANEAWRIGLVNRVVPKADLAAETRTYAERLARRSPSALAAAKRAVNVGAEMDLSHGMRYVLQEFSLLFAGDDQREGMAAFLEKREPNFTGN